MNHPVNAILGQAKLSDRHVAIEQITPRLALGRVDTERNPEGVPTPRLWDAPAELMSVVFGVVETPPTIREANGIVVGQFRSGIRPAELRDIRLECVFGVGRERVRIATC